MADVAGDTHIALYPASVEVTLDLRLALHPLFKGLNAREPYGGISEFTFANIYLFRRAHGYRLSLLKDGLVVISGRDGEKTFFMSPFGLPDALTLMRLFEEFSCMKAATAIQADALRGLGYSVVEDRDNFDYLYSRSDLAELPGRRFHKKKNLVNAFVGRYRCEGKPLTNGRMKDALLVLDEWRKEAVDEGDYLAAREALEKAGELQLCGGIYYVEDRPVAYALGEELGKETFAVHFEKGVGGIKGLMQFVNMSFSEILPLSYAYVNREQDLGYDGLRQAKESYRPVGFVKKFIVRGG